MLPVTVSRTSSHRPSARARSSAAAMSARAMPRRRTELCTMTLPIDARLGELVLGERASSVEPTIRPSSPIATNVVVVPSATSGRRLRHQAAASSVVTPARKFTPAPLATASTISAASSGMSAS